MKKLLAFLLALSLLLSCAACASQEKDEKETTVAAKPSDATKPTGESKPSDDPKPSVDGNATVLTVGDNNITVKMMNYFFMDSVNQWYSSYGAYAAYFGLDFQKPLGEQVYDQTTGLTWGKYFLDEAVKAAHNTYAMYDAAQVAGYTLPEDEATQMEKLLDDIEEQAKYYKFDNADAFLKDIYGEASDAESYREYAMLYSVANSYASSYADSLKNSYTDEELQAFQKDTPYLYNSYT